MFTAKLRARIVSATRRKPKDGSTHSSCGRLAAELGVSKDAEHRVRKEAGLQPHRQDRYIASDDPDFLGGRMKLRALRRISLCERL